MLWHCVEQCSKQLLRLFVAALLQELPTQFQTVVKGSLSIAHGILISRYSARVLPYLGIACPHLAGRCAP